MSTPDSRKRQRSTSSDLSSHASSPKRAASDETSNLPLPSDKDADASMLVEGQQGLSLNDPSPSPSPHTPPSAAHLATIDQLKKSPLKENDIWYLVSKIWYNRWENACRGVLSKEGPSTHAGPVDNSDIVSSNGKLNPGVMDGVTVELVPNAVWQKLVEWYGTPTFPLPRKVVSIGTIDSLRVEFYPPIYYVHFVTSNDSSAGPGTIELPSNATCSNLLFRIMTMRESGFPRLARHTRLWQLELPSEVEITTITPEIFEASKPGLILQSSPPAAALKRTLESHWMHDGDHILVESTDDADHWIFQDPNATASIVAPLPAPPSTPPPLFQTGSDFFSRSQFSSSSKTENGTPPGSNLNAKLAAAKGKAAQDRVPGTVGLVNLGNTCFMNSALQCLAHTPELTDYFLTGVYKSELNRTNPLGTGGALASSYGSLLSTLFPSSGAPPSSYSPREFKHRIALHAPAFAGYAQQDTQELLAFLLDGLHEDLNRVVNKPYVEKPDWEGGGSLDVIKLARHTWAGYMKRNDSVIVDLFQGQYKSTLICPECQKVSITFDPFMYLTLPIPVQKRWRMEVYYVPWDVDKPHSITTVDVPRNASFKDIKVLLGKWFNAVPDNILAAEVFNHRFYKYLNDALPVTEVGDRDKLYFYELPTSSRQSPSYKPSPSDPLLLPVFNVLPKSSRATQRRGYYTSSYGGWDGREPYAIPFFVVLSAEAASTQRGIYTAVMARLQRWTTKRHDFFRWEPSDEDAAGKDQTTSVETTGREPLTPPPEGLDEDLPASSSQQIVSPSKPQAEEGEVEMGGVDGESSRPVDILDDIFKLWLHESPEEKLESGWNMESSGRLVEWEERERSPPSRLSKIPGGWNDSSDEIQTNLPPLSNGMPMPSPLVCASDALICEFESQYAVHFFGDGGKGAESLWDVWTKHVSPEFEAAKAAEALKRKKGISISDCLDEFTKEEKLGEDDLWYCPRCKKHQQATKKFEIWKLPDILVVHLKRFSNSRMLRDKIDDFVDFPIEGLDLGDRVGERLIAQELIAQGADPQEIGVDDTGEPLVYDLFAVDEHMGGLGGGHYRAYARNDADGEWYHFDDSYVTKTQASSAVNSSAYLLFYRRRATTPLGGKTHEKVESARQSGNASPSEDVDIPSALNAPQSSPPAQSIYNNVSFSRIRSISDASASSDRVPALELEPPSFDSSMDDTLISSNHSYDFDYVTARMRSGSPSSVAAEPDVESHSDSDLPEPRQLLDEDYDEASVGGPLGGLLASAAPFGQADRTKWDGEVRFGFGGGSLPSPADSDEGGSSSRGVKGVAISKVEPDSQGSEMEQDG